MPDPNDPNPSQPLEPDPNVQQQKGLDEQHDQYLRDRVDRLQAAARRPIPQPPSVGRMVHYIEREMALHTANVNRRRQEMGQEPNVEVQPYAATITRVHYDANNQPNGSCTLAVFDPELGYQVKRDVPFSITYEAGHWSWPIYVPPQGGKR